MKQCCKCNQTKEDSEFYKNNSTSDKLSHACKSCTYTPRPKPRKYNFKNKPKYNTLLEKFESLVIRGPDCWDWKGSKSSKYSHVYWEGKNYIASRVSYQLFIGPIPNGKLICHKCDNPICTNPDHLFLGSHQENTDDMVNKKRHRHGTDAYNAKLNDDAIRDIKTNYQKGKVGYGYFAKKYGVSNMTIYDIVHGKYWKHVN